MIKIRRPVAKMGRTTFTVSLTVAGNFAVLGASHSLLPERTLDTAVTFLGASGGIGEPSSQIRARKCVAAASAFVSQGCVSLNKAAVLASFDASVRRFLRCLAARFRSRSLGRALTWA